MQGETRLTVNMLLARIARYFRVWWPEIGCPIFFSYQCRDISAQIVLDRYGDS